MNVKDPKAIQAWIEKNKAAIESGTLPENTAPKQATIRLEAPTIGRNDPCSCGSKKKFKKCCGK